MNIRIQLRNSKSRRVSSLQGSRYDSLDGPFSCGVYGAVSSRRIPKPLRQTTYTLFKNSHVCHDAFDDGNDGDCAILTCTVRPVETGGAVDEHYNVPRPPERRWKRPSGVDIDKFQWSRCLPSRVMRRGCPISFCSSQAEHETNFPVKRISCYCAIAFSTLTWAWARET